MKHFKFNLTFWCLKLFGAKFDTSGLCALAKRLGTGIDLVARDQWTTVQDNNVTMGCVLPDMGLDDAGQPMGPFVPGFNQPKEAQRVHDAIAIAIEEAATNRIPFVIVFTGMNTGEDRSEQCRRIVAGFTTIQGTATETLIAKAERLGVTLVIEMLNTVGDAATWKGHPGYLGNSTPEIVQQVVRPINSKNFRIVFDVYHVVMMNENLMKMIELYGAFIGYIHVAGVMRVEEGHHPLNRGELHLKSQQIDYPTVMNKLAQFVPRGTNVLIEYIPNEMHPAKVERDLATAKDQCDVGA